MATQKLVEPLRVGTHVKIRDSGYDRARIAEYRGPLGPKGVRVYRVLVQGSLGACTLRSARTSLKYWGGLTTQ